MKKNKEFYRFLKHVKKECKKYGIRFNLSKKRYVLADTVKCNGFFDSELMELAVAGGQPFEKMLKILTHEYGHMTQWIDDCKAWRNSKVGDSDSEKIVTLWMDREVEFSAEQKYKHIAHSRGVELDCEKRTVKLIKKFELPLDARQYIKNANAYVYFWTYVGHCRKWYTIGREPYNTKAIVDAMPEHFNNNYDKIPSRIQKLFAKIV